MVLSADGLCTRPEQCEGEQSCDALDLSGCAEVHAASCANARHDPDEMCEECAAGLQDFPSCTSLTMVLIPIAVFIATATAAYILHQSISSHDSAMVAAVNA
eukprot:gene12325-biopygen11166